MIALPKVSIVTPSYNQGQFLEDTILSVLKQDYPLIEYIIIDGGSTDQSAEIIKKYEKRVAYWVSEKDKGQTHAINKGLSKASGTIFAWLNADDLLAPSAVRIAVTYLMKSSSIGLVFGDRISIDRKGNVIALISSPKFSKYMLRWGFTIPQETAFFHKHLFEEVGRLDESLQCVMDFDLWCKLNKKTKFYHMPTVLGFYRDHDATKSRALQEEFGQEALDEGFLSEYTAVFKKHFGRKMPSRNQKKFMNGLWYIQKEVEKRLPKYFSERAFIRTICNQSKFSPESLQSSQVL